MNILPFSRPREEQESELTAMKQYLISSSRKKSKTDSHRPIAMKTSSEVSPHGFEIPLIGNSHELSDIFTRRKRTQYSGYKQCNLSKSKLIHFKSESQQIPVHKPVRTFEINMKNIARLRRRFSGHHSYHSTQQKQQPSKEIVLCNEEEQILYNSRKQFNLKQLLQNVVEKNNKSYRGATNKLPDIKNRYLNQKQTPDSFANEQSLQRDSFVTYREANNSQPVKEDLPLKKQTKNSIRSNRKYIYEKVASRYLSPKGKSTEKKITKERDSQQDLSGWEENAGTGLKTRPHFFLDFSLKLHSCGDSI